MKKNFVFDQSKCSIEEYFKDGRTILHSHGNNRNVIELKVSPGLTDPILHFYLQIRLI